MKKEYINVTRELGKERKITQQNKELEKKKVRMPEKKGKNRKDQSKINK